MLLNVEQSVECVCVVWCVDVMKTVHNTKLVPQKVNIKYCIHMNTPPIQSIHSVFKLHMLVYGNSTHLTCALLWETTWVSPTGTANLMLLANTLTLSL